MLPLSFVVRTLRLLEIRRLRHLCRHTRSLVLTYDDGPGPRLTPALLQLLAAHNAHATFFVLGSNAQQHPDLIHRILDQGHSLGVHSQAHLHPSHVGPQQALADLTSAYHSLAPWLPPSAPYRPPFGKLHLSTYRALKRRSALPIWWTLDSGDTFHTLPTPQSVLHSLLRPAPNLGDILLFHDFDRSPPRESFVLQTTQLLLQAAHAHSLNIRTIPDLLHPQPINTQQSVSL